MAKHNPCKRQPTSGTFHHPLRKKMIDQLKLEMRVQKVSTLQLAKLLNMRPSRVRDHFNGKVNARLDTLVSYAYALGCAFIVDVKQK